VLGPTASFVNNTTLTVRSLISGPQGDQVASFVNNGELNVGGHFSVGARDHRLFSFVNAGKVTVTEPGEVTFGALHALQRTGLLATEFRQEFVCKDDLIARQLASHLFEHRR
jgi:hypothetical protein